MVFEVSLLSSSNSNKILIFDNRSVPETDRLVDCAQKRWPGASVLLVVKEKSSVTKEKRSRFHTYFRQTPMPLLRGLGLTLRLRKIKPNVILIRKHDLTFKFLFLIIVCMPIKTYLWRTQPNHKVSLSKINLKTLLTRPFNKANFLPSMISAFLPLLLLMLFLPGLLVKRCPREKKKSFYNLLKSNLQQGPAGDSPWLWAWLQVIMLWTFLFGSASQIKQPGRILVIRIDHIGDTINTVPLVRYLRDKYPKAHITVLCDSGYFFWKNCPLIDEVLVYGTNNKLFNRGRRKLRYFFRPFTYARTLRKKHFDLILDPVGRTETHILSYLAGPAKRLCSTYYPYELFDATIACRHYESVLHETLRVLSLVKPISDIGEEECKLDIWFEPCVQSQVQNYLQEKGLDRSKPVLGIHPGAVAVLRLWPIERFAAVAHELAARYNMQIVFFEPPDSHDMTNKFTTAISRNECSPVIVRNIDLSTLAAFISKCGLFICNDSGPAHLAAATKTPVVMIFGPGEYFRWQPLHPETEIVRKPMDCSPCSQDNCNDPKCIRAVGVDDVLQAAAKLICHFRPCDSWQV